MNLPQFDFEEKTGFNRESRRVTDDPYIDGVRPETAVVLIIPGSVPIINELVHSTCSNCGTVRHLAVPNTSGGLKHQISTLGPHTMDMGGCAASSQAFPHWRAPKLSCSVSSTTI